MTPEARALSPAEVTGVSPLSTLEGISRAAWRGGDLVLTLLLVLALPIVFVVGAPLVFLAWVITVIAQQGRGVRP